LPSPSPAQNPSPGTGTQNQSPSPNPAQNPSPGTGTQNQSPSPNPAQNPSPGTSPETPPVTNPQEGGGIQANSPSPLVISGSLNDTPSQLARIKIQREDFPPDSYVAQLASNLDQVLVLEVFLEIDRTGKATIKSVLPASQVSSSVNLTDLAKAIIQNWEFEPTYNKQDKPFDQTYQLSLKITRQSK
jgi:hypothetical protein